MAEEVKTTADATATQTAATEAAKQTAATTGTETAAVTAPEVKTGEKASDALLPKTEPAAETAKEVVAWPEFKDTSVAAAAGLMKEAGLSYTDGMEFFKAAAASLNPADVDVKALEAKIGKDKAALVMVGIKDYCARTQDFQKKTVADVYGVMGGEAGFKKVQSWVATREAGDEGFAAEMQVYRQMLDQGGVAARAAATDLMRQYNANPNNSGLQTKMVNGDKPATATDNSPLGRKDYLTAIKEAQSKGDKALVATLNARRKAGITQGIR